MSPAVIAVQPNADAFRAFTVMARCAIGLFLEAGREATDTSPESGAVRPEDTEKLLAVAPKYGIEIKPPPT
jgi:hypothetical protein